MQPHAHSGFRLGYRRWLDGLRGVAILLVLSFHLHVTRGGFLGVDLFFVLSGFLITCLLVEEWEQTGSIRFGRFYMRRALRLLPAFVVTLGTALVVVALLRPDQFGDLLREVIVAACYVTNWPTLHNVPLRYLGHTWSLCVEEQFYICWPLLLFLLLRMKLRRRTVLLVVVAAIAASAGHRAWSIYHGPRLGEPGYAEVWTRLYVGFDTRADALLVGCLLGLVIAWDMLPRSRYFLWSVRLGTVWAVVILAKWIYLHEPDWPYFYKWDFTVVAVAGAVLVTCLLVAPLPGMRRCLEFGPLVLVGKISYGLYLFHNLIIALVLSPDRDTHTLPGETGLILGLSFGAALLSHYLVERPFLRLKGRVGRSSTPVEPAAMPHRRAA